MGGLKEPLIYELLLPLLLLLLTNEGLIMKRNIK
jgi:hypothetical protein